MKKRIITMSRQFGSGGHTIAIAAAKRLGLPFYDNELINEVAKQSGLSEDFIRENEEYASHSNSFLYQLAMSTSASHGFPSVYQKLYEAQTRVIEDLAERESCMIIGRCADYILRDREDALHIFIHADTEFRKAHILEKYGESGKAIDRRIKEKDARRRNYYHFHTDRDWGDNQNYHLTLNSGLLSEQACIDLICMAFEAE